MTDLAFFFEHLPDPESARRFLVQLGEKHPKFRDRLTKKEPLLSDVLALASYSPLLSATLLQNPEYFSWLDRKRVAAGVRGKEQLLESLARFALTNSQVEPNVLLARFRRRELLRIFLADIRRLATISEITEDLSDLADAILEYALRVARQELDNRYGRPEQTDEKGRSQPAEFCIVSLGKLGSLELNYSSDIDLLFIYSDEGKSSGNGNRGSITNREYFVKLGEAVRKIIDSPGGEGSAYRVDMRLRPHGRVGALALSLADTVNYYKTEARSWERQVLIRSRASAGDFSIFRNFSEAVTDDVFASGISVAEALAGVLRSKEQIDKAQSQRSGFNVKLGKGGIREIEFIAQALQIAHGGRDEWLRAPHTLKSLSRLSDRSLLSEHELTELFDAYTFLRQLEHILQMEHGLQTHTVPENLERRISAARRMRFDDAAEFELSLEKHTGNVNRIFERVFGTNIPQPIAGNEPENSSDEHAEEHSHPTDEFIAIAKRSRRYSEFLIAHADAINTDEIFADEFPKRDYRGELVSAVENANGLSEKLGSLRRTWSRFLAEIVAHDLWRPADLKQVKRTQADLAEAAIEAAVHIVRSELEAKYAISLSEFPLAVMGLGKLGGAGIDYDSDLDLVMVYADELPPEIPLTPAEFYTRSVEIFVNALSAMTRDGSLYRVDLRLRPHGKNGAAAISRSAFREYIRSESAIWELLAYLKLRAVGGDISLGKLIETEIREEILKRAANIDTETLAAETLRIRRQLRENKTGFRKHREIDIKFGEGGMLDIYFALRFLQLRDGIADSPEARSTDKMLDLLREKGSLDADAHSALIAGYDFLSALDHNLRLIVGRTTKLPTADTEALTTIAHRLNFSKTTAENTDDSVTDLLGSLTQHRHSINEMFLNILER